MVPACGECGSPMVLRQTYRVTYDDGTPRKFWGCSQYPHCRGTHSAHRNGNPVGIPADRDTKAARRRAHQVFDQLWQQGKRRLERRDAYRLLGELMHLNMEEAHIGRFTLLQCEELIAKLTGQVFQIKFTGPSGGMPRQLTVWAKDLDTARQYAQELAQRPRQFPITIVAIEHSEDWQQQLAQKIAGYRTSRQATPTRIRAW